MIFEPVASLVVQALLKRLGAQAGSFPLLVDAVLAPLALLVGVVFAGGAGVLVGGLADEVAALVADRDVEI